jgi:hypothetical protein
MENRPDTMEGVENKDMLLIRQISTSYTAGKFKT